MEVIKCGTKVLTKIGHIEGMVTAVSIRFESVQYEVSYFHDGDIKTAWVREGEFDVEDGKKIPIGFR